MDCSEMLEGKAWGDMRKKTTGPALMGVPEGLVEKMMFKTET